MAIRTDIFSIDWSQSPRIIWVNVAFTEVSAQDLYDTCRHLEALHTGMDEPSICDAGGWEPLGLGVKVGITVSLFNAQYAFVARPGPEWIICNMTGGNVVAFEDYERNVELYPRYPTSFVSADRTASSSATTQEQHAIQFGSYNNGVTIDILEGVSGTYYDIGTSGNPVGNLIDAHTISNEVGLPFYYIVGDLDIDEDLSFIGKVFYGESPNKTTIDIGSDPDTFKCEFIDATVKGTLDGNSELLGCYIEDLNYLDGKIERCGFMGTITLSGSGQLDAWSCKSRVAGILTPEINFGGSGSSLILHDYQGGIKLTNKNGPENVTIDLAGGQVKINMTTVTNGQIVIRGTGKCIDSVTGEHIHTGFYGDLEIVNEAVNIPEIVDGVWAYERV